ncbi:ABC transporter ATP-binding protein [Paenarthrobacter sp. S56]|uniref:ABC transporter ATP-binding protein n=1 Tax=Paenarthrobacter sp. S56 TaxID=3138179 RepID=UPI00321A7261
MPPVEPASGDGAGPDGAGHAIETDGLAKRFGHRMAVDGIDLAVPRGSVFGFLGPNGSGKTTTIRMLLGLASADQGRIKVLGKDMPRNLADVLPGVGALVEGPGFYPFLSGAANLMRLDAADRHATSSTRRPRVEAALERVGLGHAAGKKVRAYSLGMKQRLGLANALLRPRELLVLDEPTNGLDPQGTREVRGLVRSLAAGGTTVFVSSHLLAEVEQMCTHVGVMSAGRLVAQGPLQELRSAGQAQVQVETPDAEQAVRVLSGLGLLPTRAPGRVLGTGLDGVEPEAIVAALVREGVRVRGFSVENASLEDRYVSLTGEGFDVAG